MHGRAQVWERGYFPRKCCKVFLCISSYSKTPRKRNIYSLFSQFVVRFLGFRLETPPGQGSIPGPRWGTFVPRPLILPTPDKNPAGAYDKMMMSDVSQVAQLTYMLSALLHDRELTNSQNIQAYFLQGLTWSLGAVLLEDGSVKFDAMTSGAKRLQTTAPCLHPVSIHQMAPLERGSTHPIKAYYSFIDLEMMKSRVGLVG